MSEHVEVGQEQPAGAVQGDRPAKATNAARKNDSEDRKDFKRQKQTWVCLSVTRWR